MGKIGIKFNKLLMASVHWLPMKRRPTKLWYYPLKLDVEITTRCNLSCDFCYRKYLNMPKRDLMPELFKRVLEVFPNSETVNFVGLGEPFLNPHLFEEIRMAKADARKVCLTTNGTMLNVDAARRLVSLGVDEVYVSLNAITKRTSGDMGGDGFDRVVSGIRKLQKERRENGSDLPKITVQTLILRENARELRKIGRWVKKLGSRWSLLHPFCISKEAAKRFHVFGSGLEDLVEDVGNLEGLETSMRPTTPMRGKCYAPWNVVYITTKGEIYACCFLGALLSNRIKDWFLDSKIEIDSTEYKMGSIREGDTWNSKSYRELRKKLSKWQREDKGQKLSVDEYKKLREESDLSEKFSYCKICQDRFGAAC